MHIASSNFRGFVQPSLLLALLLSSFPALGQTTQPATSPSSAPATQPADLSFSLLLTQGVAPCTLHVHATEIPLTHGTPLTARYQWDFGDPKGKYNSLAGWSAAHVYDRSGQYAVTLTLT